MAVRQLSKEQEAKSLRVRLSKVDEFQLLTCIKHRLWGANRDRFHDWAIGDTLGLFVDRRLAAIAEVNGKTFFSHERVWNNGVFPFRIPIAFRHLIRVENRLGIEGPLREALIQGFGPNYAVGILNMALLPAQAGKALLDTLTPVPNDLRRMTTKVDTLLAEEGSRLLAEERSLRKNL